MKTFNFLILSVILLLHANWGNAQNLIAVQNGNTPKFYQQVDDAIANSVNGDTIYIPGGSWNITKPIDKCLHIFGVGHNPDSTKVTFQSILNGHITLKGNASNGGMEGIYLNGMITGTDDPVNSFTISRCRIGSGIQTTAAESNFIFIDNILEGGIQALVENKNAINFSFYNNVISAYFLNIAFTNSTLKNNIFLHSPSCNYGCSYSISGQYAILENNIFSGVPYYASTLNLVLNSVFRNNLFYESINFPINTNVGANNIIGQAQSSIFVNQTGNAFDYSHDYHLKPESPGKNAGTDGTDIGIYGGIYPWKEGSVPANPHFQSVKISPKTDDSGNLNVRIKVAAQDN